MTPQAPFQIVGESLSGHGLSFDVGSLKIAADKIGTIAEIAEVAYRQGRDSACLGWDDRFDLSCAIDALRALAVIVGPTPTGDRYRRAADTIARLLHDQQEGGCA